MNAMSAKRWCTVTALMFLLIHAHAQTKAIEFSELDKVAIDELKARQTPGAAIAVLINGRLAYIKGYGVSNVETGTPVTTETLFRMGSTTKMFTAAALVTLAANGKIKLDAPIGDVVKELHPSLARLTPHQLLTQSSGLRDFASPITSQDDDALAKNVTSWKEDVFFTDPGKIYSYSSAGYWLAGHVVEALHGKPYADAMDELIFQPLGMKHTTLRPLAAVTYSLSMGHSVVDGKPAVMRPIYNNVAMWPGGSIISNANELARFATAMLNDGKLDNKQVLSPLVISKLPAKQFRLSGEEDVYYGYGLMNFEQRGVRVISHGGASRGYGSSIDFVPEHKFAVIALTNRSGETLPATRMKAMELALPLKPQVQEPEPKPLAIKAEEMNDYVGRYVHAPQTWEVYVKDGKLYFKQEGSDFELTKTGVRTFNFSQGQIVFVAGTDGKTEHLFMGLYSARKVPR